MRKYRIEFEIKVQDDTVSDKDIADWARYTCGDSGGLSCGNPLSETSFDPVFGTFKIERLP